MSFRLSVVQGQYIDTPKHRISLMISYNNFKMKIITIYLTLQSLFVTISAFIFDAKLFAECANTTIQNIRLYRPSTQEYRLIPVDPSGYDIDVWLGCLEQQDIYGVMTISSESDDEGLDSERQELHDGVNDLNTIALNTTDMENIEKRSEYQLKTQVVIQMMSP